MDILRVLWGDIKNISGKKFLALAIIVIMMIPVIYGGLYLAAFWDPYGKTDRLPVTVVNLDTGGVINNKKVNYGNDIVKDLKKDKDLKWNFVSSSQTAQNNLLNGDSYATVIIPEGFSENLSKADSGVLKKPQLIFVTNKKKNYIIGLIMDKAATTLKDKIDKNIIDNIGTQIYDNFYELKDGMESASNGSSQIKSGIGHIKNQLPTLNDGVSKLYNGASTLSSNMASAVNGSNDLKNGLGVLNSQLPDLMNGTGKLLQGSSELTDKIGDAWNGSKAIKNGIGSSSNNMEDGINTLYNGAVSLQGGLYNMHTNIPQLVSGISSLRDGAKQLNDGIGGSYDGSKNLINGINQIQGGLSSNLSGMLSDSTNGLPAMIAGLNQMQVQMEGQQDIANLIKAASSSLRSINPDSTDLNSLLGNLSGADNDLNQVTQEIDSIIINSDQMDKTTKTSLLNLRSSVGKISSGINQMEAAVQFANKLNPGIETLLNGANNLSGVLSKLNGGSEDVYNGLDELYGKTEELDTGTDKLYAGSQSLTGGIGQFRSAVPGLQNGINTLSDGLEKIYAGSQTVTGNLGQLNGSVPKVQTGVDKLYDGSTKLSDGLVKLSDGSVDLKNGIKELQDKLPALKSGVNKLYDGIGTLHDKLADGAEKLSYKLGPSSSDMGNFISDPLKLNNRSLYAVNGYGQGLAPYFISLGLWVGALLMFFLITSKVPLDKKVGPISSVLGKYMTSGIIGIIQSLCLSVVVLCLGLRPSNMLMYFLFNMFLSLTFVAIMQNLVFIFGDIGRFISILILIFQLTSCGGTFPEEVLPKFFQIIGKFLPFTYSVSAIREISWGINYSVFNKDITVLAIYLFVFLALTLIVKKFFGNHTINLNMRDVADSKY